MTALLHPPSPSPARLRLRPRPRLMATHRPDAIGGAKSAMTSMTSCRHPQPFVLLRALPVLRQLADLARDLVIVVASLA